MYKLVKILIVIYLVIVDLNCNRSNNITQEIQDINVRIIDSLNQIGIEDNNNVIYLLPAPVEMLEYISFYNISFESGLTNPSINYKKYVLDKDAALNLGIYISDLAYMSLFKRTNESLEYIEAIENLMNQLRLTSAINNSLINRIKDRYNVLDSLAELSGDIFDDVNEYLKNRKMYNELCLIAVGGYIESLHFTLSIVDENKDNKSLLNQLMDQKYLFDNLYSLVTPYINQPKYSEEYDGLNELKYIFDNFREDYEILELNKDENEFLQLKSKSKIIISNADINNLKETLKKLREQVIN